MKQKSLYRKQVIDRQKHRLQGSVVITQSIMTSVITALVFVLILSMFTLIIYGTYDRRERVVGYLVPDKGLVKIFAPTNGLVINTNVTEGQKITVNDLLFSISTTHNNVDGADLDAILIDELQIQKSLLLKKIKHQSQLSTQKKQAIKEQINGIEKEYSHLKQSIVLEENQSKQLLLNNNKMQRLYLNGHVSELTYQESKQRYTNSEVAIADSRRLSVNLINQKNILLQHSMQLPIEWENTLVDLNNALSELEQRIIEISGRRNYAIHAPINGNATALQVSQGQRLNKQLPLLTILPENSLLEAELFLPTRAAGFITKGQLVYLRYGAFPYQHYGLQTGTVINVVKAIIPPNEISIPIGITEPVYRVKVELDSQEIAAYGKKFPLQSGMLLDADIVLETIFCFLIMAFRKDIYENPIPLDIIVK